MKKIFFNPYGYADFTKCKCSTQRRKNPYSRTMVEKLDKKLNLTDEQEKQITTLYSDFFKQDLSREERKSAMQELEKKITSLLTDEQKEAFEQMKKERPQRQKQ